MNILIYLMTRMPMTTFQYDNLMRYSTMSRRAVYYINHIIPMIRSIRQQYQYDWKPNNTDKVIKQVTLWLIPSTEYFEKLISIATVEELNWLSSIPGKMDNVTWTSQSSCNPSRIRIFRAMQRAVKNSIWLI